MRPWGTKVPPSLHRQISSFNEASWNFQWYDKLARYARNLIVELKPENATRVRAQPHNTSLIRDLWTEMSQLAKYPSCLFPTIKRKCQRVELYSRSQPLWNSQTLRWSNFSLFVFLFQISISLPLSLFPAPFLLTLDKYTFALLALVSVNAIEIIVRREEEDTIILFKCKRWRDNRIV